MTKKMKKYIALTAVSIENSRNLKYHASLFLIITCSKCKNKNEKIFKEEESIEI